MNPTPLFFPGAEIYPAPRYLPVKVDEDASSASLTNTNETSATFLNVPVKAEEAAFPAILPDMNGIAGGPASQPVKAEEGADLDLAIYANDVGAGPIARPVRPEEAAPIAQPALNAHASRLSDDIFTHLAEILLDDGMQRTLGALNLASQAVHAATLPLLYRKVQFEEHEEFDYIGGYGVPRGWRYIRYLSIHKTSLAILKRIDRFVRLHQRQQPGDLDTTTIFPQLVCMRVNECKRQTLPRKYTYWLDLFRPMSLNDIHNFFDTESRITNRQDPCYSKYLCIYQAMSDLEEICIRKGAYLLPSAINDCGHCTIQWRRPKTDLSLEIDDEVPNVDTVRSMEIVLDMINYATVPEERRPLMGTAAKKKGLILTCRPRVFEAFIRVLQSREPLLLTMQVDLKGQTIAAIDMERYLDQLAAIYEKSWVHNDALYDTSSAPFVWIHAGIPLPMCYARQAKQNPGLTGALAGQLDIGQRADAEPLEGNPLYGFNSRVLEGYANNADELLEDGDLGAVRNYPCADAPKMGMAQLLESDLDVEDDYDEEDDEDYDDDY